MSDMFLFNLLSIPPRLPCFLFWYTVRSSVMLAMSAPVRNQPPEIRQLPSQKCAHLPRLVYSLRQPRLLCLVPFAMYTDQAAKIFPASLFRECLQKNPDSSGWKNRNL